MPLAQTNYSHLTGPDRKTGGKVRDWPTRSHAVRNQRRQLEAASRRALVSLIDIGTDVFKGSDGSRAISGQVIVSVPGSVCMTCLGFLNKRTLVSEATADGDAGSAPQVVWSNGSLAPTAVGPAGALLTDWSGLLPQPVYLSYGSNGKAEYYIFGLDYLLGNFSSIDLTMARCRTIGSFSRMPMLANL